MDWNALFNGFSELVVVALVFVLLFYVIFSLNLKVLGTSRNKFVLNEAIAIYLFGAFAAFALICKPMLLSLHSNLAIRATEDSLYIFQFEFYKLLVLLVAVALVLYALLFVICIFLFTRLTFSVNEVNDIRNNNRRSAIVLSGILIATFYACSYVFDLIFSNILQTPGNDFIF